MTPTCIVQEMDGADEGPMATEWIEYGAAFWIFRSGNGGRVLLDSN